ncbi:phenylacetate--CoA ligase family protein [Limnoglobus roseus]|uniref:Phenylacetate--CoA ligase family protein n=1 Tax=Limnoglobus roseus TaxID=2598579 RepID=A0A5C1AG62_9BACT|nr:AMP-binding protein [Limnoglobus roseus]QEL16976.1 phenylacetate--CoA ligase family protein [Limnoglobus roseus]
MNDASTGPEPAHSARLQHLIREVLPANCFYAKKYQDICPADITTLAAFRRLPFTTKAELVADQRSHPPYGTNHTAPLESYTRLHQTSGTTTGKPLCWLDTPGSWAAILDCWHEIFQTLGLTKRDALFFPFSFGPFLGFWSGFEGAVRAGFRVLSGGGMSSTGRLRFLQEHRATVIFATPTYAYHLTEVAAKEGIALAESAVRLIVVAGEPGGNIAATRARIETGWGAKVVDHYGLTEVGPVALEPPSNPGGLEILDEHCFAEVIDPVTLLPTPPGDVGELVLTTLRRTACPLIRYRTGDLVRQSAVVRTITRLDGGILGRADEMFHVRGNNVYPGAIEAVVRRFPEVAEYRITVDQTGPLADLCLEVEPLPDADVQQAVTRIRRAIQDELLFRADVVLAPAGSLPRFEMKAKRLVVKR